MRSPRFYLAALVAALLTLAVPSLSEGGTAKRKGSSVQKKKSSLERKASRGKGKRSARSQRSAASGRARIGRKAARPIHRRQSSQVVVDRVEVASVDYYGPFLPVEPHDYPRPPCPEVDAVLTAHVHEQDEATPELLESPPASVNASLEEGLARIARRLGSLFRPKSSEARVRPEDVDLPDLLNAGLQVPVEGVDVARLRDSFLERRGRYAQHLAIDIGAPRGTPVIATAEGEIIRLTRERRGGISIYQKDASGRYLFFYCHLSRYAEGLEVGQRIRRGEVIGYVGSTGRVIGGPHLHFSITHLPEDDDDFKNGLAINPYLLFLAGVP